MSEAAIHIENLTRDFGTVRALDGLSLDVPAGAVFGFLGPNGSGKTTTLNLLLGLLEPTGGWAEVLGFDTRTQAKEVRARSGALLEHSGVYEQLSAEDNLEFYGRIWRMSTGERQSRIRELLDHIGMWDRRKERVGSWSKGMKQKLALARTLLHRPSLVFLDEPTAGLDVMAAAAVRDDLETLAGREGVTIFLTTHNMAEAEKLCAQVAVIRKGTLMAVGPPDELRARAGSPHVEITGSGFDENVMGLLRDRSEVAAVNVKNSRLVIDLRDNVEVAPLISLVVGAGVRVEEVQKGKASLEDVFLALMEEGNSN